MCHTVELKSIERCCSAASHLLLITADFLGCDRAAHICEEEIKENRNLGRSAPLMQDFQLFLLVLVNVGVADSERLFSSEEPVEMALLSFTLS